jgi:hypothetical protein
MKKNTGDEIPATVEQYMKSKPYPFDLYLLDLKAFTLDALSSDVKARNSFF